MPRHHQDGAHGSARGILDRLPHARFLLFLVVFLLVAAAFALEVRIELAIVAGFDAGALAFLAATLPLWSGDVPDAIRRRAARDDGGRGWLLLVSLVSLMAVFGALFSVLASRVEATPANLLQIVATLALAWLFINTIFAHHYGHLYYEQLGDDDTPGLDFPGTRAPVFSDFCYFSFVIGMTSQVSDVTIHSSLMRKTATLHGLLAFTFNLGVMAMTINVLAGALN